MFRRVLGGRFSFRRQVLCDAVKRNSKPFVFAKFITLPCHVEITWKPNILVFAFCYVTCLIKEKQVWVSIALSKTVILRKRSRVVWAVLSCNNICVYFAFDTISSRKALFDNIVNKFSFLRKIRYVQLKFNLRFYHNITINILSCCTDQTCKQQQSDDSKFKTNSSGTTEYMY